MRRHFVVGVFLLSPIGSLYAQEPDPELDFVTEFLGGRLSPAEVPADTLTVLNELLGELDASRSLFMPFDQWLESVVRFLSSRQLRESLPVALLRSYWEANRKPRRLALPKTVNGRALHPVDRLGEELIPERGMIALSRVGFSATMDTAIVTIEFICRGLCGSDDLVLYVRDNGRWRRDITLMSFNH